METNLDTGLIRAGRSIVTLIVFVVTNIIVLFPFHIPIFIPRQLAQAVLDGLASLRIIQPRRASDPAHNDEAGAGSGDDGRPGKAPAFIRLNFPMNFMTAPLVADLFLLAISAIGRNEVYDGTIGSNHIRPYDIMLFFISLAYIAISIDASGLIRYLAFKVLQWGGKAGHRLFFYLYTFFFALGTFIGNDPIILSGTAFLAYMTRVSSNIVHPRAWIYTQFAVANIASATLVTSNPTNLVLAGAVSLRFVDYTANMIVPVIITAIVLFPFLLYIVFADESLIPRSIKMHDLPDDVKGKKPVNPNIPNARGEAEDGTNASGNDEQGKLLSLEEIMNPFLDKKGAAVGAVIMAATLVTVLAFNAANTRKMNGSETPVCYITMPAAVLMLGWDLWYGWLHRHETRDIARKGRQEIEENRARRAEAGENRLAMEQEEENASSSGTDPGTPKADSSDARMRAPRSPASTPNGLAGDATGEGPNGAENTETTHPPSVVVHAPPAADLSEKEEMGLKEKHDSSAEESTVHAAADRGIFAATPNESIVDEKKEHIGYQDGETRAGAARPVANPSDLEKRLNANNKADRATLTSLAAGAHTWCSETFPTVMAVLAHLPLALIPFAFSMFVLVEALGSSGWVPVFAFGWTRWVEKTGPVGAIGGMGFLSVVLCNFSGTNIGTTILLCRVVQAWVSIYKAGETHITERTFWAAVFSMALGVNYGAFSTAFSASLAGLLWRDILARKHIHVRGIEFARVNVPIIAIAMTVGSAVLVGEVYLTRKDEPFNPANAGFT